jgi:hypothetical protein
MIGLMRAMVQEETNRWKILSLELLGVCMIFHFHALNVEAVTLNALIITVYGVVKVVDIRARNFFCVKRKIS